MTRTIFRNKNFFNIRAQFLVSLFLVVSVLAVYWQVTHHDFVNYDDGLYVTDNSRVQNGLTLNNITWAFTADFGYNWHPVTWLSHMLDCQLYGMSPGRHHMTNVLFHILNSLLLFFVFRKMTGDLWQSGVVAALFALHPLHVESVAWVAERKDVLSTFFWMLSLWGYIGYVKHGDGVNYLLSLLFFILGLMAKPMVVTLPFVFLLLDFWPLCRFQLGQSDCCRGSSKGTLLVFRLIWEKIPFFIFTAASCIITFCVEAVYSLDVYPFKLRIANSLVSYICYIRKMIWTGNLACFYPYPKSIPGWQVSGACFLLIFISIIAIKTFKHRPYLLVGWLWYLGTLVPVIGLVQIGLQSMADRYTYVPLIGLFIIIAWGVPDMLTGLRHKKIILIISTVVVLSISMICTWFQIGTWKNSITLFEHAVMVTKNNYVAYQKLGEALAVQGETQAAIRHYSQALRIRPDFIQSHLNLGIMLRYQGKLDPSMEHFSRVLKLKPDCAEAHNELGYTLSEQGKVTEAATHYHEAIRIKPNYAEAHNNLGVLLANQDKDNEAMFHFYEAIRINSDYAEAYFNLGKVFANHGKTEDAIFNYRKALQFKTDMSPALYQLSWILASHENPRYRNGQEAVRLAERLCKITQYNQPLALDVLAAAYAESGRFNKAILTAQKALKLGLNQGKKEVCLGLKKRLRLYQKRIPCRQALPGGNKN
jgi:tetratricopeptide (TPR) repeat protein